MSKEVNFRSRSFGMLLYPDNVRHMNVFEILKSYDYCYILHDQDVDEDGVLKKAHYHVILRFKQARWLSAVAKELFIEERFFIQIRSDDSMMEYLIHLNDEDKHQYSVDEIKGTLKNKCVQIINKDGKGECDKVLELIEFIDGQDKYISVRSFAKWCALQGYWDVYRRSASIMNTILQEHNNKYKNSSKEIVD